MRENGLMIKFRVLELVALKQEIFIKVNGMKIKDKAKENMYGVIKMNIMETGLKINEMDMVLSNLKNKLLLNIN